MLSAILNKNKEITTIKPTEGNSPLLKSFLDITPFNFTVSSISMHGLNIIGANFTLSSAGKVICVANNTNYSVEEIDFVKAYRNCYYFRSNVTTFQEYVVAIDFSSPLSFFCKAVSLLPNREGEAYYKSPPFYLERIDID